MIPVRRTSIRLKANPRRVLPRFLGFSDAGRFEPVIRHVSGMEEQAVEAQLEGICSEFESRHINLRALFEAHYQRARAFVPVDGLSPARQLLIGAYFTHEYSVEAAALFNPSIVPHPDQSELEPGALRFILSLRAVGEGHISSAAFKTGIVSASGGLWLDPSAPLLSSGEVVSQPLSRDFVARRIGGNGGIDREVLNALPEYFTEAEALKVIGRLEKTSGQGLGPAKARIAEVFNRNYSLEFEEDTPLSSRIIFPRSDSESNGMEDVRFVRFREGDKTLYLGTYTAYNGRAIYPQLLETEDFRSFRIRPFYGKAAAGKGMAFFPEKINGKYAMVGRQDGRNLTLMYSDNLYFWDSYELLQQPQREWELLQMGNCGSPVKTPQGWLLLTHAVGPMRKYVLSLTLLSLEDPSIVLASLGQPLLSPNEEEREGYVPNVLYTCGMMQHRENLIIPYAMSDSSISFAVVETEEVIKALLTSKNNRP